MNLETYRASSEMPWNEDRVMHLHRRAAFGATESEISRDLADGPTASINRLTHGSGMQLNERTDRMANQACETESIELLQAAWINEMWYGPDPLREQLALMWHNHFATSYVKVRSCRAMWEQIQLFRRFARAPFGKLLEQVIINQAMLVWLDGSNNRRGYPNENLARELLELFTLGIGNYTEMDVKETARALTGWAVEDEVVRFVESEHDQGYKSILARVGKFDAIQLAPFLARQPATARRIAWRICDHFLGENQGNTRQIDALSQFLISTDFDINASLNMLLQSADFFSATCLRNRFASPISFVVQNLRSAQCILTTNNAENNDGVLPGVAAIWLRALGQDLLRPPGVGGWQGGRTWLSTATMFQRARFALRLAKGELATFKTRRSDLAQTLVSTESQFD